MMNFTKRFSLLFTKYLNNELSLEERGEFFDYVATGDFDDIIEARIEGSFVNPEPEEPNTLPVEKSHEILDNILKLAKLPVLKSGKRGWNLYVKFSIAASLIILAGIFLFAINKNADAEGSFAATFKSKSPEKAINNSSRSLAVTLPDGSRVSLQPYSSLYYSKQLFLKKREVFMEGEAMFTITKDPQNPFYVYYHDVVTKVLGTTFNVGKNKTTGNIEVSVFTGKVQVYENSGIHSNTSITEGLIVTPNQKAIYKSSNRIFKASLIDKPVELKDLADRDKQSEALFTGFFFENAGLSKVFKSMALHYNVEIIVSNDNIYNCVFTGDLSNLDFFDKLKIICLATHSDYEISGTKILIKGDGCNYRDQ